MTAVSQRLWIMGLFALLIAGCWAGVPKHAMVDLAEEVQVTAASPAPPLVQSVSPTPLAPTPAIPINPPVIQTATRRPTDSPTKPADIFSKSGRLTTPEQLPPGWIEWEQAIDHVGEILTVCGPVASAHFASGSNGQPTFLNIGNAYPNPQRFTLVIWGSNRGNFIPAPEQTYLEREICATGEIELYQGVPEIEVKSPTQIANH